VHILLALPKKITKMSGEDFVKALICEKEDFIRRHVVLSSSVIHLLRTYGVIGEFTHDQIKVHTLTFCYQGLAW